MVQDTELILPDLISICPFPWSPSPYHARGSEESIQWADSYNIFSDRKRAFFIMREGALLASYAYSYAEYEEFRTCVDFVNVLFILDEVSDTQSEDGARQLEAVLKRALDGEGCDGSPLSRLLNSFMQRMSKAAPLCRARFTQHCAEYFRTVVNEVMLRSTNDVYDIEEYLLHRRDNGGVKPCFDLFEYAMNFELPEYVSNDINFAVCLQNANDLICLANDLYSYAVEHEGHLDGNNAIQILMRTKGLSVQEAANWIEIKFREVLAEYLEAKGRIRSYGSEADIMVVKYLHGTEQWISANIAWSFDSQRYFGTRHKEVKETLKVTIKSTPEQ